MANEATTTPAASNTTSPSFLTGVVEGLASALGTVGAAYVTAQAQKGTATPGATGSGTPATATGNPATVNTGMSNAVKYALIAAAAVVLLLLGIKLIKK